MNRRYWLSSWKLTWKFLAMFLLLVILPVSVFGYIVLKQTNQIMRNEAVDSTVRIMNTVQKSMTSIIRDVEDISSYMIFSPDFRKLFTYPSYNHPDYYSEWSDIKEKVTGFLTFHLMSKGYIGSIELRGNNGVVLQMGEPLKGSEEKWSQAANAAEGALAWTDSYVMSSGWNSGERDVISLFRQINNMDNMATPIGEVRIRLKEDQIYQLISSAISKNLGSVFILRNDGIVVVHEDRSILGKKYPDSDFIERAINHDEETSSFSYRMDDRDVVAVSQKIQGTNWHLVAIVGQDQILSGLERLRTSFRQMIVTSILLGLLALIGFYVSIIRPITDLIKQTRRLERGDFTAKVKIRSGDEIGMLGQRFNRMVTEIQRLIETKFLLEIKQKDSDLRALQSQIDPHFLYNTLDMIRWTARIEKAMKTSNLIETLSRFFRMGLSGGKVWIPLKDELTYVSSYLELQRERLGHKLKYAIYTDVEVEHLPVLKQMLQPLVENSIVHGFQDHAQDKRIVIRCYASDEHLIVDVIDNGSGLDSVHDAEVFYTLIREGGGYALKNIHERLTLAFGETYGLGLVDNGTAGVWLRIRLPLRPEDKSGLAFDSMKSGVEK